MPQAARAARAAEDRAYLDHWEPAGADVPRRTVTITGHPDQPVPRHLRAVPTRQAPTGSSRAARVVQIERRRPPRRAHERLGSRPDRLAMWAVLMALFLIIIAATSAHG